MEVLGIDVGGSGIKGAPVNIESGELVAERERIPTPQPATPKAVLKVIKKIVAHFDWTGPIGCAFPARIKHGAVATATNISKDFLGVNLASQISDVTGLPARALNDADAAGIAEMRFGAGRNRRDVVLLLTVGTGIGSALFVDGTLVPNTEFGHFDVGGTNGELLASDRTRKKKELSWKQWAKRLQKYLDRVEFLLAPDLIIVGGGVSRPDRAELYFDRLETSAELVPAQMSNAAGIVGAALCAEDLLAARTP